MIAPAAPATPIAEKTRAGIAQTRQGFTLRRYRVTNFRSVTDSGYLDLDHVTALIGVNESGKTNLLLPLWKMNPAGGGSIDPTSDFPKALFGTIRANPRDFQFVTAEFDTGSEARTLAELAKIPVEAAATVCIGRSYDGSYTVSFPLHLPRKNDDRAAVSQAIGAAGRAISATTPPDTQTELHAAAVALLREMSSDLNGLSQLSANDLIRLRDRVAALIPADPPATSVVVAELRKLRKDLGKRMAGVLAPDPGQIDTVRDAVLSRMPAFVYYSNYGNLDSEIYLPHVVENMARTDLGAKEAAKARTLRVLFGFVGLEAEEVLQLGRDFRDIRDEAEAQILASGGKTGLMINIFQRSHDLQNGPNAQVLADIAEAKRTRSILLQSASTKLTAHFAEWWKQGDYRFRFEADGNHFRIWVADSRRPQEVELENRSTGLQWFLSFFLVFLHESRGEHHNAVLLLDEPGHSLHPLAQRDLSAFFDGLAKTNQIVYTTHSPFLVDADRLERARKVFVEGDGSTRVSGDLGVAEGSDSKRGAGFAVRAALNIAVAEAVLGGARPVLVGNRADQIYLSAMKTLLVAAGRLRPQREIIFAPATGPRVMQTMAALLAGEDTGLPTVVFDGTRDGRTQAKELLATTHANFPERIVCLDDVTEFDGTQIEDVVGFDLVAPLVDRVERRPDRLFVDYAVSGVPLVAQVEAWVAEEGIPLDPDWRFQLANRVRARLLLTDAKKLSGFPVQSWEHLMGRLISCGEEGSQEHNAVRCGRLL
ncbi:AAA family ATPase [Roseobacter sp. HKCCD9010]|nr:AAA family ATPase [Rhodobacterales bacterium HKCCD4356]NNV14329.1 AAA family ATPase [Roseobacter sp. HKCCD7357]NNV18508.1 AAA family ATPase [Roseobacter sp. HKCCD8768]NNV27946.1 AAA family ATPase [Roseobacter sp. HKCCD8192]NNV32224.1 AAA family ATPase [Roseobacter sp. HKCCD9061]NNV36531.1 AAA family ATPase [Roseobacter sp. HKCCD9073]NNV40808.1 AAA family ATPase [Roseobacter sp. HKCCD9054]NNV45028.1 AAA family ATPase [Roseobacter sp. HKCCD6497]NNV49287.1 AAA family ATPase [Roseobacter sp.